MKGRSLEARLRGVEKILGQSPGPRAYSLLQLVRMSYGLEVGEPEQIRKLGERPVEELILETRERASGRT
jgi:hypothetical protein